MAVATQYSWVREEPLRTNRGAWIDSLQARFGFYNAPWCAMAVSEWLRRGKAEPSIWSARAIDFALKGRAWKLSDIIYDRYVPKPGDLRVKSRRGGNHVDMFVNWDTLGKSGIVIGGNVSDRVQFRRISLQTMIADGTTHIVQVEGKYEIRRKNRAVNYEVIEKIKMHATYYHGRFHGRRTSSGVKYDSTKMTAAHHSLPLGTMVMVENPSNGKRVLVQINDRCPKAGVIDLSKAAADSLAISSSKVFVYILRTK